MRWDNLFDDLESQLEQGLNAEEVDLQAEEERLRLGRLSLRERILSVRDSYERKADYSLRLMLTSGDGMAVRPATVGRDWLAGDIRDDRVVQRQCIVPLASIAGIALTDDQVRRSLNPASRETEATIAARLSLPFVLRELCRRRQSIEAVTLADSIFGTIDRVGRDHFDLAVHEPGEPRRESAVTQHRIMPLQQLVMVRV